MKKIIDTFVESKIELYKIVCRNTAKQSFVDGFSAGYHYSKCNQCKTEIHLAKTRFVSIETRACQRGYYTPQELDERRHLLLYIQNQTQESYRHLNSYLSDLKQLQSNNEQQCNYINRKVF